MAAASSLLRGARWLFLALLCALRASSFAPRSAPRSAARRSAPRRAAATDEAYDAVIIGSGFGGLCCGALLAHYGQRVVVLESHEHVGGCAHGFRRGAYTLDSGPSLWAGCSVPSTSPLRQVMDAVGAEVDWVTYDGWGVHDLRAGEAFRMSVGPEAFEAVVRQYGDVGQWRRLLAAIEPVVDASMACPPMALRADPLGFLRTALGPYLLPAIASTSLRARAFMPDLLTGPAAALADLADVDDAFVLKWLDYLAFALSGRPADDTVGAAVAYTLGDLHRPGAFLDYPVGGSGAVAEALAASIAKAGSEVRTRAHVAEILVEGNEARGVRLRDGSEVRARRVVSNADIWNTVKLLPARVAPAWRAATERDVAPTPSFVHLWVGFDGADIPADLDVHHTVFNEGFLGDDSAAIDARENMYIISIPSLFDASLAPEGKHVAHCYAAAHEPFEAWEHLDRTSQEYKAKKEAAAEPLWRALEAVVPDIRKRSEMVVVGTPLTHRDFLRRHRGSYGPSGVSGLANGLTPVDGLYTVGDSNFPGIGVPAAAASGILVANALAPLGDHLRLLDAMGADLKAGTAWWGEAAPPNPVAGGRIALGRSEPADTLGRAA